MKIEKDYPYWFAVGRSLSLCHCFHRFDVLILPACERAITVGTGISGAMRLRKIYLCFCGDKCESKALKIQQRNNNEPPRRKKKSNENLFRPHDVLWCPMNLFLLNAHTRENQIKRSWRQRRICICEVKNRTEIYPISMHTKWRWNVAGRLLCYAVQRSSNMFWK